MSSTDTARQTVEDVLFEAIATFGPERSEVRREATFEELDVDSLDVVELAQMARERWGIMLDPEDFSDVRTVGDAVDVVLQRMP